MRVALVYERFGLATSLERDRVLLARALVDRGLDIHIYATVDEGTADVPGTTLHDVGRPVTRHGRLRHPWDYARFAVRATSILRRDRDRYDIVDVAGTTAWEHDVLRVHAVTSAEQGRWPERGGRDYRFARARALSAPVLHPKLAVARSIEKLQFRPDRYALALAVTDEVAQDLRRVHGVPDERIEVVPYPIVTNAAAESGSIRKILGLGKDALLILFVGHDFARKGLDDAIRVVAGLEKPAHLAVIGAGEPGPYARLAEEHGAQDRVHFLGVTENPEAALCDADVLLLPTREDVWGIVLIEAMAAGVPVVTTSIAGAAAAVHSAKAGLVVEDASVANLHNAMARVLADPEERSAMGGRGRAAAAAFSVARVAERTLKAYERVFTRRRQHPPRPTTSENTSAKAAP